jgi:hypothetical protein
MFPSLCLMNRLPIFYALSVFIQKLRWEIRQPVTPIVTLFLLFKMLRVSADQCSLIFFLMNQLIAGHYTANNHILSPTSVLNKVVKKIISELYQI